jgi:hypothetical protein
MEAFNRLTKAITILIIVIIVAGLIVALWGIYFYIPGLRENIRLDTAAAVGKWFQTAPDGNFTFVIEIEFTPRRCYLKDVHVNQGSGRALDDISFMTYELTADSVELDLNALIKHQPLRIIAIAGMELKGEISLDDLTAYFAPDNSGIDNITISYDDFTEKTIMKADIVELMGTDVTITGKWGIADDGSLALVDRGYRNPDGPVDRKVIEFIEEHTNISIQFKVFDIPLDVKKQHFDGETLSVELERK